MAEKQIKTDCVTICAGSPANNLTRSGNQQNGSNDCRHFEIVSLAVTVSTNGFYLHSSNEFVFKREKNGTRPLGCIRVHLKLPQGLPTFKSLFQLKSSFMKVGNPLIRFDNFKCNYVLFVEENKLE